jgi:hypothetical protein
MPHSEMTNRAKAEELAERIALSPSLHHKHVDLITAALDAVTAQSQKRILELEGVLKHLDQQLKGGNNWHLRECPECGEDVSVDGHGEDCTLAAALLGGEDKTS